MKIISTIITFVILLIFSNKIEGQNINKNYIFSWDTVPQKYDNILPVFKFGKQDLENVFTTSLKNWTDRMPNGYKALRIWLFDRSYLAENAKNVIYGQNGDTAFYKYNLPPNVGDSIPFIGPWWEEGVSELKAKVDTFFRHFKQIGGELDYLILDMEKGISNWDLNNRANQEYEANRLAYFTAIKNDPRFTTHFQPLLPNDCDFITTIMGWSRTDSCYMIWNQITYDIVAGYINEAIFEPVKKYYPNIKMCEWNFFVMDKNYPVPGSNGHKEYLYGNGAVVGTNQNRATYGGIGQISDNINQSVVSNTPYPRTRFNVFKYDMNKIKAMKLASSIPISTWITYQSFGNTNNTLKAYKNSNFYQEMIFHTYLSYSKNDFSIYWAYVADTNYVEADDSILDLSLKHLDTLMNFDVNRTPMVDSLIWWFDDFVVSGTETDSFYLWRFTPLIDDSIYFDANYSLVTTNPAIFSVNNRTISFPNTVVVNQNAISNYGFWIKKEKIIASVANKLATIEFISSYPNPFTDELQINILSKGNDVLKYNIVDLTGELIYSSSTINLYKGDNTIILNHPLNAGIYFMTFKTKNSTITQKIIKN